MAQEKTADAKKPNAGRIYDYILGGNHNFEVDRQAAEQVLKLMPYAPKYARLQRWTLQDIAVELSQKQGYEVIIDFASGLPTEDHIHHKVPEGTIVIYSDNDPITVEYAHQILGDIPNVYYIEADATQPEVLLNAPQIQKILSGRQKVAFVFWGVTAFLSDQEIKHVTRYLYDWSSPDSCLAFNAQIHNPDSPAVKQVVELYKKMGTMIYIRLAEDFDELIEPWKLDETGWIPLLEWHGFDESEMSQEDADTFGPMAGGKGTYLIK